jgi:hypothetical protein
MTQLPMDTRRRGAARCSWSALVFSAVINGIVRRLKLTPAPAPAAPMTSRSKAKALKNFSPEKNMKRH